MLEVVALADITPAEWDAFCCSSDEAWFWHTTDWLAYTLDYRPDLRGADRSFLIRENNRILGICPLLLERVAVRGRVASEFSYAGAAGPAPALAAGLSSGHSEKVQTAIMEEVDRLAAEHAVERVSLRFTPLSRSAPHMAPFNPLLRFGFIDVSLLSQVIDLAQPLEAIRRDLRKGHAYDVKRGLVELTVTPFDQHSITSETFDSYREMHRAASGRVTRSRSTFDRMEGWVRRGDGVLFGAFLGDEPVGYSLVMVYGAGAYYASACNDPNRRSLPVAHVLQWEAIAWLKEHGIHRYETGWQPTSSHPHCVPSEKELRIGRFKRGFGGLTVPLFGGEKYYSRQRYLEVTEERTHSYADMFLPLDDGHAAEGSSV